MNVPLNEHIFRAYDVRGNAERDLSPALATSIGRAIGTLVRRAGHSPRVAIGRDARLSGPGLCTALAQGLGEVGCIAVDIGIVATPLLYFAVHTSEVGGGVMVTGSHNPPQDNGFKMMIGDETVHGETIQRLKTMILEEDFDLVAAHDRGKPEEHDIRTPYEAYIRHDVEMGPRPLHVVIDAGNGPTGPIVPGLLRSLGCRVEELYCELDGLFPNHHPDPTVAENLVDLQREVLARGADLGIAYDGDGDRIGVVDEHARIIWGDRLLVLLSSALLAVEPGATIVAEVKCSQHLFDDIEAHGGRAIMSRVGHSLIKSRMRQEQALLAGEMSGHVFYKHRYFGFDDAIYTTCRLLEILSQDDRPLSEHLVDLPQSHATPELRLDCPDAIKFSVVERVTADYRQSHEVIDIDGVRVLFENGWGLVRASNTGPILVLRCEADDAATCEDIHRQLLERIDAAREALSRD